MPGKPHSIFMSLAGKTPLRVDSAVVQVNGVEAFGWFALRPIDFRQFQARRDCPDYAGGDLILQRKDVSRSLVEMFCPDRLAV